MNNFFDRVYWSNSVQLWLTATAVSLIACLTIRVLGGIVLRRMKKFAARTASGLDDFAVDMAERALVPLANIGSIYFALSLLVLPKSFMKAVNVAWLICLTYYLLKVFSATFKKFVYSFLRKQVNSESKEAQADGLVIIINRIIWLIGIVFLIENLGYNISTLVAGLGIGGIAIALAAQAILADLFSYFVIFFDRPFEIGDFVVVDDKAGVIEHIGIKTTRLRTLGGEQLVCSNTNLTNARLHNYKRLQSRRVNFKLGVTYKTSPELLKQIPPLVKEIILAKELVRFDRAHFSGYGDSSLEFEFVYYVDVPDYNTYMDIHQSILYDIFEVFEQRKIDFAYPTRTIFLQPQVFDNIAGAKESGSPRERQ